MGDKDHSYKLLFSHPEMVRDLLQGFVREEWVKDLDFNTLERMNGSYVSDDLRDREDDVVWRVRFRDRWLYVYLLLEFQSTVDKFMALRMMTYPGLLYQDLVHRKELTEGGLLPPVLPVLLYNGEHRWNAATEMGSLIEEVPDELDRYAPRLRYLLLDEGTFSSEELGALKNLVAALFKLENSRSEENLLEVVTNLLQWIGSPEQSSLRRAFTVWINRVLTPKGQQKPVFEELEEVRTMLSERVKEWNKKWIEQGIEKGQLSGKAMLTLRLLEKKYGPVSVTIRERIESANAQQLYEWSERILTAKQLADVFTDSDEETP